MADPLTIDVIDRPAGGALRAMRRLAQLRSRRSPQMRQLLRFGTAHFRPRPVPGFTPRRIAAISIWDPDCDVETAWQAVLGDLCAGAREHWHVGGEIARAAFSEPWRGWRPDTDGVRPLAGDEPALVLISGQLKARHLPVFARDAAKAVAHALGEPGYLGGLGINNSLLNTTSCSAWRTYDDARTYAFRPGAHADAMRRDRAGEHHSTEWFLRIRPVVERGTLAGRAPFRDVLAPAVAA